MKLRYPIRIEATHTPRERGNSGPAEFRTRVERQTELKQYAERQPNPITGTKRRRISQNFKNTEASNKNEGGKKNKYRRAIDDTSCMSSIQ